MAMITPGFGSRPAWSIKVGPQVVAEMILIMDTYPKLQTITPISIAAARLSVAGADLQSKVVLCCVDLARS